VEEWCVTQELGARGYWDVFARTPTAKSREFASRMTRRQIQEHWQEIYGVEFASSFDSGLPTW
jgi:hypothetical protein